MSKRLPPISILAELASTVTAVLRERGLGAILADSCAREIAQGFARSIGGRTVYIPGDVGAWPRTLLAQRDAEIRETYNGKNAAQLARRYGVSVKRIMQIVGARTNVVVLRRTG